MANTIWSPGRNNSFGAGSEATTGQKNVLIGLNPPRAATPGVVFQDMTYKPAPALKMSTWIGGKVYNLADYKGKYVVIDIWGSLVPSMRRGSAAG